MNLFHSAVALALMTVAFTANATYCPDGTLHAGQGAPYYPDRCNEPYPTGDGTTNTNENNNNNENTQGQQQGQGQGQTSENNNDNSSSATGGAGGDGGAGGSVDNSGNSSNTNNNQANGGNSTSDATGGNATGGSASGGSVGDTSSSSEVGDTSSSSSSSVGDTSSSSTGGSVGNTSATGGAGGAIGDTSSSSSSGGNTMTGGANSASADDSGNSNVSIDSSNHSVFNSQSLFVPEIQTAAPALVASPQLVLDRGVCGPIMVRKREEVNGTYVGIIKKSKIPLGYDDDLTVSPEPYHYWTDPYGNRHVFGERRIIIASNDGVAASRAISLGGGETGGNWGNGGVSSNSSMTRTNVRIVSETCELEMQGPQPIPAVTPPNAPRLHIRG